MFNLIKFLLLLAVAVLGAAFASVNPEEVMVNYYFGTLQLPMGLLILLLLGMGIVIGMGAGTLLVLRVKRENIALRRRARLAHEEVNNLRTLPLKDR